SVRRGRRPAMRPHRELDRSPSQTAVLCVSCSRHTPCAGEGNHARAHPRLDLSGRWNRVGRAAPGRPRAELLFVLVSRPARLIATLGGNVGEHALPASPSLGIITVRLRAPAGDQPKLAVEVRDVLAGPPW